MYVKLLRSCTLKQLQQICLAPGLYAYRNSHISANIHKICDDWAIALLTNVILKEIILIICGGFYVAAPMYKNLFEHEHVMIYAAILPFTDPTTDRGFYINFAHQSILLLVAIPAIYGVELVVCMVNNSALITAALIEESLKTLDEEICRSREFNNELEWKLRNTIQKIQDFNKYLQFKFSVYFVLLYMLILIFLLLSSMVSSLVDFAYWRFFLLPPFLVFSITLSIFLHFFVSSSIEDFNLLCIFLLSNKLILHWNRAVGHLG